MNLSSEDALRLNVLVASAQAIRIDEGAMAVYGLSGEREMRVELNPTCRGERYLSMVREMLSGTVLGSPGGYPVFLRRWTRTGEISNAHLDKLLMLGEPEAVLAVARAPIITDELARRAWWAAPSPELGRCLLANPRVVAGPVGPLVANYLLEYLPFETEHRDMLETVALVLQPGLIDEAIRRRLWESGRMKKTYRLGFLAAQADDLPERLADRADLGLFRSRLEQLAARGNGRAATLLKALAGSGQTFLEVAEDIVRRPADQEVVSVWLNVVGDYFGGVRRGEDAPREIPLLMEEAERLLGTDPQVRALREALPELEAEIRAMVALSLVEEALVIPIFALSDAVGSLMRKKIAPVSDPVLEQFATLRRVKAA